MCHTMYPVSYTHLDVYKRQGLCLIFKNGKKRRFYMRKWPKKYFLDALAPVSYTHLDVYKRQLLEYRFHMFQSDSNQYVNHSLLQVLS